MQQVGRFLYPCPVRFVGSQDDFQFQEISEIFDSVEVNASASGHEEVAQFSDATNDAKRLGQCFSDGIDLRNRREDVMGSFWFGAVFALIEDQLTIARSEGAQFQATIGAREKRIMLGDDDVGTVGMMTAMGYDAVTMGNHDFDNGMEGFYKQLPHANFPILSSNYDFSNTILNKSILPYKVFKKDGLKIGVFGVGIELHGLVEGKNYGDTVYLDPVAKANEIADVLKNDFKCDLVICLSHLGYKYNTDKVSDQILAKNNKSIDLIIGGHTHTFMDQPEDVQNLSGAITTINQVGFAGINLGRVDYYFERYKGKKLKKASPYLISNKLEA